MIRTQVLTTYDHVMLGVSDIRIIRGLEHGNHVSNNTGYLVLLNLPDLKGFSEVSLLINEYKFIR